MDSLESALELDAWWGVPRLRPIGRDGMRYRGGGWRFVGPPCPANRVIESATLATVAARVRWCDPNGRSVNQHGRCRVRRALARRGRSGLPLAAAEGLRPSLRSSSR